MIEVSRTTQRLAKQQEDGRQTAPEPPTAQQAAAADLRLQNLQRLYEEGCSVCSRVKLGRSRIMSADQGKLICILLQHSYPGQLSDADRQGAAACKMPQFYAEIWNHTHGLITVNQVVARRPRWDAAAVPAEESPTLEGQEAPAPDPGEDLAPVPSPETDDPDPAPPPRRKGQAR